MSARVLLAVLLVQVLAGLVFLAEAGPGFPLDDTWVHLVYARALGHGEGFAYNPGLLETGVSAPLWTVLLAVPVALADALGQRPDLGVRVLATLAGVALALAGGRLVRRAGRWPSLCVLVALSLDPLLTFERYSGMEQPLFGCLLLLLLDALLDEREGPAGLFAGLLVLTRPEGLLPAALALAWLALRRRSVLPFLGRVAACLLPWIAYCQLVGGRPWPSTVENKAALAAAPDQALTALQALFGMTGWGWALPLTALLGSYVLEGGRRHAGRLPLLTVALLLPAIVLSRPLMTVGDPPLMPYYWARYGLLVWPLLLVLAAAGLASVLRTAWAGLRCRPAYAALLVAPLVVVLLTGRGLPARAGSLARAFAAQCADVEALNVAAGRWVDEHLPEDALVATHDAGAVRFFGRRPVLDIWGNHSLGLRTALREGGAQAATLWLQAQAPDALVVFPALYARDHSPELKALFARTTAQQYAAYHAAADDYAALFGLTERAATFEVAGEPAVVPDPLHAHMAVFVRP